MGFPEPVMPCRCQVNRAESGWESLGAGERGERGVWRWMLITSGAEGRALQVLPLQRTIDWTGFTPNRLLLQAASVSSQPPERTSHAQSITAKEPLNHRHFSFHTRISVINVTCQTIYLHFVLLFFLFVCLKGQYYVNLTFYFLPLYHIIFHVITLFF